LAEPWIESHPKTSLLPALFLDQENKFTQKQSVVYDKNKSPEDACRKTAFIVTPSKDW
jgi:hypothetical protein